MDERVYRIGRTPLTPSEHDGLEVTVGGAKGKIVGRALGEPKLVVLIETKRGERERFLSENKVAAFVSPRAKSDPKFS
jgi:hypothetical protein